jgi:hypothetical protein
MLSPYSSLPKHELMFNEYFGSASGQPDGMTYYPNIAAQLGNYCTQKLDDILMRVFRRTAMAYEYLQFTIPFWRVM